MKNDIQPGMRYDAPLSATVASQPVNKSSSGLNARQEVLKDLNLQDFSVTEMLRDLSSGNVVNGRNAELLGEFSHRTGQRAKHGGVVIPRELVLGRSTGPAQNTVRDEALVGEDHLGQDMIEMLRNVPVIQQVGSTVLPIAQGSGNVSVPRQSDSATAEWIDEGAAPTNSVATFDNINMTPHTVAAYTDCTRRLRLQADPSIESLIRSDLSAVVRNAIDKAAFGSNASEANAPEGILDWITAEAITASWGAMVDAETKILVENSSVSTIVMSPQAAAVLKTTPVVAGSADFIMESNQTLLGHRVILSNNLPDVGNIYFAKWTDFVLAYFSDPEILVDPYSLSTSSGTRTTIFQDLDFGCRHEESFVVNTITI